MINKWTVFASIFIAALTLAVGITIGHFGIRKDAICPKNDYISRQTDPHNYKILMDSIQASNIEENLRDLTSRPHLAGLAEDLESAKVIEKRWLHDGFKVTKLMYNVLLSYPDDNNPNRVTVKSGGSVLFETAGVEAIYDSAQPKTVNPFLAYTPNGTASSSRLFYANFGTVEDMETLVNIVGPAELRGSIIIMRYGRIFRGDKVMHAQSVGAAGAILYNDPIDSAPLGTTPDKTYDQTWYMPESGVQRGTAYTSDGDPLTPVYPSTDYMYRLKEENIKTLPKIPAQPIGYGEARRIMQHLSGAEAPTDWRGRLADVIYRYGGTLTNATSIEITSYNRREKRDTYNVVGIMRGEIEPDRYIVIGNHRDAWTLGALDPTSGTAILLELSRVFGEMYKNGFRPRRSLMFCSWGAEEYGLIGSVEYVQEYVKVLGARVVSYLNLDVAVSGNYTIEASASPLLSDVIIEAATMVPSAYDPTGQTVYDKWMRVHRNNATNEPIIEFGLGSGSDFLGFDQLAGSSNCHLAYLFNAADYEGIEDYPLYHTSYEVFSMMKTYVDPTFAAHRTIAQLTGVLAMLLSESPILPFNVTRYNIALQQALMGLKLSDVILGPLRAAIDEFCLVANAFVIRAKVIDIQNPLEIRMYNDQLLQLERAFLNPLGQGPDNTDLKHIIYAPATNDKYIASGFPAISDAIVTGNQTLIEQQIAIASYFVRGALSTLKDFSEFIA